MAQPTREIDLPDHPKPKPGVVTVEVGTESVVLDGWREASVLSPSGTQIWCRLDGHTTLAAVTDDLARTFQADRDAIASDVLSLVRQLACIGLLDGVDPDCHQGPSPIALEPARVAADIGDTIEGLNLSDIWDGRERRALPAETVACLLVNWSPHCGYCTSILDELSELEMGMEANGIPLVLYAYGSAEASQTQADLSSWRPHVILKPHHEVGPFIGYGTPAAFHLDADGTLLSAAARGTEEVLRLAAGLAGLEPGELRSQAPSDARYLLERGGSCAPGAGSEPVTRWAGTHVYRIGDWHVGLRYTSNAAAELLDELLDHEVVEDPRAGHIYTLALPRFEDSEAEPDAESETNLLVLGSQVLVRSRSRERVLRALLWRLDSQMQGYSAPSGLARVNATAVLTPAGAALLQPGLYTLEEELQPAFARHDIAFVDVVYPEIDLQRAELVVPEPLVPHDAHVLAALRSTVGASTAEPDPVRPGRYPLIGWGVTHVAEEAVTEFSPAQSAAATLSFVLDTEDPSARVRELGELFEQVSGVGLWYHSEAELADAVADALNLR